MPFCQIILVCLFYFALPCHTLLCTTKCEFISNLSTPFSFPNRCTEKVAAGQCRAEVTFFYERDTYEVRLYSDPSQYVLSTYNNRFVSIQFYDNTDYFSYSIQRACKKDNDCARDLIKNAANETLSRTYSFSTIMNELKPVLIGPPLPSVNSKLQCYSLDQQIRNCNNSTVYNACAISNDVVKKTTSFDCKTEMLTVNSNVHAYHSDSNYISFQVNCNRSLCNTQSTLDKAKEILFKHGVTVTPDGRLAGSQLIVSIYLMMMMMMMSILIINQF